MKKSILLFVLVILISFTSRENQVYHIPFDIPGSQMAATLPPFGIFIESKHEGKKDLLGHEMVHWGQYEKMGFFGYYSTYISEYLKYGRMDGPMEIEARKLNKFK